jgi:uncharacterized protein (DUF488 family)
MNKHALYTIGYEGVSVGALIRTLKQAGVKTLIDVRAVPLSRKPGFSKNILARSLAEHDIAYLGLKGLGTPPDGRAAARRNDIDALKEIFGAHMKTEKARLDLDTAITTALENPSCLLCFEHSPACCHRSLVAADIINKTGQSVINLDPFIHGDLP